MARAPWPSGVEPHRLVFDQFGDGEAVMRLDEGEVVERDAGLGERPPPGFGAALELQDVALRHRQEILHVRGGAEGDGPPHARSAVSRVGDHDRRRAVRDQRAVGALQRAGDERVLLGLLRGRTRSRDPCASARRDCRRRSCGSSRRSGRARRTGRRGAGSRRRRSCRTRRRSRPASRRPPAR